MNRMNLVPLKTYILKHCTIKFDNLRFRLFKQIFIYLNISVSYAFFKSCLFE